MCVFVCFSAYDYSLQVNGKKGWLCVIMTMSKSTFLIFRQIVENDVDAFSEKNLIVALLLVVDPSCRISKKRQNAHLTQKIGKHIGTMIYQRILLVCCCSYAQIFSWKSHDPVQRALPSGLTPTHDTCPSWACCNTKLGELVLLNVSKATTLPSE